MMGIASNRNGKVISQSINDDDDSFVEGFRMPAAGNVRAQPLSWDLDWR